MSDCVFANINAGRDRGALWSINVCSMTNCSLSNSSSGRDTATLAFFSPSATIVDCTLSNFLAGRDRGFAVFGSATFTRCTFANSTAARYNGGLVLIGRTAMTDCAFINITSPVGSGGIAAVSGADATLTNCTFTEMVSRAFGGTLFLWQGGHIVAVGCTFRKSSAPAQGGLLFFNGGSVEMYDCTSEETVGDNGGALYLEGGASLLVSGGRFASFRARTGGAVSVAGGSAVFQGVHFEGPGQTPSDSQIVSGGIVLLAGGYLEIDECVLTGGRSGDGAGIAATAGTALVRRSTISACEANTGGGVYISSLQFQMEDCAISDCKCTADGSALQISSTGEAIVRRTTVLRCTGTPAISVKGGAISFDGGLMHACVADQILGAGAILVEGRGTALVSNVRISDCQSYDPQGTGLSFYGSQAGGASVKGGSFLTLYNVTFSGCTAYYGANSIFVETADGDAPSSTVRAALLTIVPSCTFPVDAAGRLPELFSGYYVNTLVSTGALGLLLGGLTFETAPGCGLTVDALAASGELFNASGLAGCGAAGVCGTATACQAVPTIPNAFIATTATASSVPVAPTCSCEFPNAPNPSEPSVAIAPYSVGCVTPRRGQSLQIIGDDSVNSLVVRLGRTKDPQTGEAIEATTTRTLRLTIGGTAAGAVRWAVDPSTTPEWLTLPNQTGSLGPTQEVVDTSLTVSTRGQPEQDQPYEASVAIRIFAAHRNDTLFLPGLESPSPRRVFRRKGPASLARRLSPPVHCTRFRHRHSLPRSTYCPPVDCCVRYALAAFRPQSFSS